MKLCMRVNYPFRQSLQKVTSALQTVTIRKILLQMLLHEQIIAQHKFVLYQFSVYIEW